MMRQTIAVRPLRDVTINVGGHELTAATSPKAKPPTSSPRSGPDCHAPAADV